jgi:hypothetical protein
MGGANLFVFLIRMGAVTVEVFLHRRFGARHLGAQAAVAVPFILVFGSFWPENDPRPLWLFLGAYLFMFLCGRIGVLFRQSRGDCEHSRYNGWPRCLRPSATGTNELRVKEFFEPFMVAFAGVFVCEWNPPLGSYLLFAAGCLYFSGWFNRMWDNERAMDLQDAISEQQHTAQSLRKFQSR